MPTLYRDAFEVLGRMRWLVVVFLVAFPLETAVQRLGRGVGRPAIQRARLAEDTAGFTSAFRSGVSNTIGVFSTVGLGRVIWLSALFVVLRSRWTRVWLKVNAQLGATAPFAFWSVLACAVVTLLQPFTMILWRVRMSDDPTGWRVWAMLVALALSGWLAACAAAFWQTSLYPVILRAWAGQQTQWRDLNRQPASGWDALKTFNFLMGIAFGLGVGALGGLFLVLRRQSLSPRAPMILASVATVIVQLVVLVVPFGVVMRQMPMRQAIHCSIRIAANAFFSLMTLLVPLAIGFAVVEFCRAQLGWLTGMGGVIDVLLEPLRAFLTVFGLVAGTRLFDQLVPQRSV